MPRIAKDKFPDDDVSAQGRKLLDVTPSDTDDIEYVAKALLIDADGTVCMEPADGYFDGASPPVQHNGTGYTRTFKAGDVFDAFRVRRVYQTGTTSTAIRAIA